MQQTSSPPSHRRWVWRPRGISDVGNRSFPSAIGLVPQLPCLLPAVERVVPGRWRPVGQYRKGPVARATTAPSNPDLLVPLVVCQFEALSMTDDGPLAANWTDPREQPQRELGHPGSIFSVSGSATKRITVGVQSRPSRQVKSRWLTGPLLINQSRTKKEYRLSLASGTTFVKLRDWPVYSSTTSFEAETTVNVAAVPLKVTLVAPVKSVPRILTAASVLPKVGSVFTSGPKPTASYSILTGHRETDAAQADLHVASNGCPCRCLTEAARLQ